MINKQKKLYGNLLSLDMKKEEVLEVVEKFYSEWGNKTKVFAVKQAVIKFLKDNGNICDKKIMFDIFINDNQPLCSPFDLEEAIKELELKGEIYQPRKEVFKLTYCKH